MTSSHVAQVASKPSKQTIATRLHPAEIQKIEAAAAAAGTDRAGWLRDAALARLRERNSETHRSIEETLLGEIIAVKFLLLNLFTAANAGVSVAAAQEIRKFADSIKHREASEQLRLLTQTA